MNRNVLIIALAGLFLIVHNHVSAQVQSTQVELIEREIIDTIYSESLQEYREYWIRFPENYNPQSDEKYPVVYLLDGFSLQNSLTSVYDNYWGHYLPHMILVGISNRVNRTRDLTTSQIKMRRGSAMDAETGGAGKFTEFIENELIPHIDLSFPTTPYRTLIGHSYAGLFTINMLVNHPHLFQNYIAIDPSLDWDDQKLMKQAKEKFKTDNFEGKSLYVSLAAEQLHMFDENITIENIMEDESGFTLFARSIIDFSNFLSSEDQNGLNFSWKVYHEDLHGTVPLPSIRDGLIFLFKWYQFLSPQKYNNPETPIEDIESMLKNQQAIYTRHLGYSAPPMIEEMLTGYGYMNMQMGQPEKAFLFFQLNIEHYPKSANAYNAMSEYYQSKNDLTNALKYTTKAFEISGSEIYKNRIKELESMKK